MSRKTVFKSVVAVFLTALFFAMTGCGLDPFFVRVVHIEGVPDTGTAGTPLALTATIRPAFASNKDIVWSVKDAGNTKAEISGNILNAHAEGTVTIRATIANGIAEGKEYAQDFNIVFTVPKVITDIAIKTQPDKLEYFEGETLNLSGIVVTLTYDDDTTEDVGPAGFAAKGITTSPSQGTPLALAHNGQPVTVSAGEYSADTDKLTVEKGTMTVPVTGVKLDKDTLTLIVGSKETLTAQIDPANATNKNVTWSSSAPAVATVDTSGLVTAVATGSATITVTTEDGGFTATCAVTVTTVSVPVTGVKLDKDTLTLSIGGKETLTAQIDPANATNKAVTWSSSNTAIATVDANGVVTAVASGTATITVTTADGGFTATCTVTVIEAEARIGSTPYAKLTDALTAAANGTASAPTEIIILKNITASEGYTIPNGKNIKLNVEAGQNITITAAAGNFNLFSVSNTSSSLTLGPTASGGTLTLSGNDVAAEIDRRGVYVSGNGRILILNDGVTITGFKYSNNDATIGGSVYVDGGTFTMEGGEIKNNSGDYKGSGVYVINGTFTMEGGKISGNTASGPGGGVYIHTSGTFTMNGGEIMNNISNGQGGGVFVASGIFTMNSGKISDNISRSSSSFANGGGGGVYVYQGTFTMNGGEIMNNTSIYNSGGGVLVNTSGTFIMNSGKISDNTAGFPNSVVNRGGGGVYVYTSGTFEMKGGEIMNNTSPNQGGGVYVYQGTFTMSGGSVYGTDDPAKANIANGTAPKGVTLYRNGGTARYGNGNNIVSGTNNGIDTTITGIPAP